MAEIRREKGNDKKRTERQKEKFVSFANCSQSGNAVIEPCRQAIYHQRKLIIIPLAIRSGLQIAMMIRNAVLVPRFALFVDTSNQGLRHHLGLNERPACAATPIGCSVEFCLILEETLTFSTRHKGGRDKIPENSPLLPRPVGVPISAGYRLRIQSLQLYLYDPSMEPLNPNGRQCTCGFDAITRSAL